MVVGGELWRLWWGRRVAFVRGFGVKMQQAIEGFKGTVEHDGTAMVCCNLLFDVGAVGWRGESVASQLWN